MLLHGLPLDRTMWKSQVDALVAEGWFVVTPDLRGHGESPLGEGAATMDRHAADLAWILDELGIREAVLVGFSLGGYIAFQCWADFPERIRALVLADTRAEPDSEEGRAARGELADAIFERGMPAIAEKMIPAFFTQQTWAARPKLVADVRQVILANPPVGAVRALQGMAERPDRRPLLPTIHVPVLVIVGESDPLTPPDSAQAMWEALPQAELVVFPGSAHLSPVEVADDFNHALLDWIRRLPGATAA